AETDPHHAWVVFRRVLDERIDADFRFYTTMMAFCKRYDPGGAVDVMRAAEARGIYISDAMFCSFLAACQSAEPVLLDDALDAYARCGPRTYNVIFGIANICRVAKRPASALFLVADIADNDLVAIDTKLLSIFAACCAEAMFSRQSADTAERLFDLLRLKRLCPPADQRPFSNLIKPLLAQERIDAAMRALDAIDTTGMQPSAFLYTKILSVLAKLDRISDALDLVRKMVARGLPVDTPVLSLLVAACGRASDLAAVQVLYEHATNLPNDVLRNDFVVSAFVSAFAHCSDLHAAENVFRRRCLVSTPGVTPFNAMIAAYSHHGMLANARQTYDKLKRAGLEPTPPTLASLLAGCSHVGDLDQANAIVDEFQRRGSFPVDGAHMTCLIDLHGRVGNLDEAERIATETAGDDIIAWLTLLSACRKHDDVVRAERAFARIQAIPNASQRHVASAYSLMAVIYGSARRNDDSVRLREEMHRLGLSKTPAKTSLYLPTSGLVAFVSEDEKYFKDAALKEKHAELVRHLDVHGYAPDTSQLVASRFSSAQEARRSLSLHSEVLAIAYGLLHLAAHEPIRLTKNLRVCPDCHETSKRISALYKRDIFTRDASRHHFFRNGQCSCGDYW
ncbi:hypothetical protein PBRA_006614, partial [Plasmodiophora brassicae]